MTESYEAFKQWWEEHGEKAHIGPNGLTLKGLCRLAWITGERRQQARDLVKNGGGMPGMFDDALKAENKGKPLLQCAAEHVEKKLKEAEGERHD